MPSEIDAMRFGLQKTIYKKSFFDFVQHAVQQVRPNWTWHWNWHIKYLCDLMQSEAERLHKGIPRTNDYLINIPPRTTKSLVLSVCFNAWLWTWYPECSIMTISHNQKLAISFAYLTRILMNSDWYRKFFSEVQLMPDDSSKGQFTNKQGGTRRSFGCLSGLIGESADIIILDDPNNAEKYESKKVLESINSAFDEAIYNRLNNAETGFRVVLQQRVHQLDLTGHLLDKDDLDFKHICLPAEDGLLDPVRLNPKVLNQFRALKGSRGYATQYQQKTTEEGGNIMKQHWFPVKPFTDDLRHLDYKLYLDTAYTEKSSNDATGGVIAAKYHNSLVIRFAFSWRLEFPDLIRKIKEVCATYKVRSVKIEPKASGISIGQQLRRESKLNIIMLKSPKDDKESRVNSVAPICESERVILMDGGWNTKFLDEVCTFPLAKNDDQVDAMVYAIFDNLTANKFNYGM